MKKAAIIMAGGTGTRFWPMSRRHRPKQVLSIGDQPVMLQQTIDRLSHCYPTERIYVITADQHKSLVDDVCDDLPSDQVIGEPEGRDTAACAGLGGLLVEEWHDPNTVIGVFPADHRITPVDEFSDCVDAASKACHELGGIATFGIEPEFPSTGYGYIEYDGEHPESAGNKTIYPVRRFTEKPDRGTARTFLDEGRYLWNSGMFFWKAGHILNEIDEQMPELSRGLENIRESLRDTGDLSDALEAHYHTLPETSVDYGIMEHADTVWTLPVSFTWSDLGTWDALETIFNPDTNGNVTIGDVETVDVDGSILVSGESNQLIGAVGVDDLVVVATGDAVLVCRKDRAEDVKKLVNQLSETNRDDVL